MKDIIIFSLGLFIIVLLFVGNTVYGHKHGAIAPSTITYTYQATAIWKNAMGEPLAYSSTYYDTANDCITALSQVRVDQVLGAKVVDGTCASFSSAGEITKVYEVSK
ncbi:hypothetical protein UFOVP1_36 [uncultured Caudovirales phage]|uniref:Uncharacterized protein n=1 Tax=uncultured Caudovirales phage TaxID=2100421 RepID=A0A6J5KHQ7_9CAUD|nr:hypothetical protein UFOVP1_36 [uncultured Caudovirales phage]